MVESSRTKKSQKRADGTSPAVSEPIPITVNTSYRSPEKISQTLLDARTELRQWVAELVDQPARTSVVQVLRNAIRKMEQAEHSIRTAQMMEQGGTFWDGEYVK